jgi:hypothetical protein
MRRVGKNIYKETKRMRRLRVSLMTSDGGSRGTKETDISRQPRFKNGKNGIIMPLISRTKRVRSLRKMDVVVSTREGIRQASVD